MYSWKGNWGKREVFFFLLVLLLFYLTKLKTLSLSCNGENLGGVDMVLDMESQEMASNMMSFLPLSISFSKSIKRQG